MTAATPCLGVRSIDDEELGLFQSLFKRHIGLHLAPEKKALLVSRFARRLAELEVETFREYHGLITARGECGAAELQRAVDLITTNETRYFRETQHFDYLRECIAPRLNTAGAVRVWSAACASGEEAYSIAMVLEDALGGADWRVLGSDISQRMLRRARRGLYPMARCERIPPAYLKRYCLRGQQEYEGQLLVERALRERVDFTQLNLMALPEALGAFDVIFLRNVIIYFDLPTKASVVQAVLGYLRPGGYLVVGLAESLNGIASGLHNVAPAVYRKPG